MVWKPHATVAAIVERQDKFLLVEERSRGQLVINQPAGHLEPGESLLQAVVRETLEETAWHFQPEALTGIYHWRNPDTGNTFLRACFCGAAVAHEAERALDEGIVRALWLDRAQLLARGEQLRSPMVMQCIDDYLAGKRYPLDVLVHL